MEKDKPNAQMSKDTDREIGNMLHLLRRVYNACEMAHLYPDRNWTFGMPVSKAHCVEVPKKLVNEIYNYLLSKSETFAATTLRRQKRYKSRQRKYRDHRAICEAFCPFKNGHKPRCAYYDMAHGFGVYCQNAKAKVEKLGLKRLSPKAIEAALEAHKAVE